MPSTPRETLAEPPNVASGAVGLLCLSGSSAERFRRTINFNLIEYVIPTEGSLIQPNRGNSLSFPISIPVETAKSYGLFLSNPVTN